MDKFSIYDCCFWPDIAAEAEDLINYAAPGEQVTINENMHHLLTQLAEMSGKQMATLAFAMQELYEKEGRK